MNWSDNYTLTTPAGTTEFNPAGGGDGFYLTADTSGLDDAAVRSSVEDKPQTDGFIVHPGKGAGMRPTLVAQYKLGSGTIADRDAAFRALALQLRSIRAVAGTLTHHNPDASTEALSVQYEVQLVSSGGPQLKQAVFGLVSAADFWS
jgi:hypothetical protein